VCEREINRDILRFTDNPFVIKMYQGKCQPGITEMSRLVEGNERDKRRGRGDG